MYGPKIMASTIQRGVLRESVILVRSSGTRGILIHTKNREIIIIHKDGRSIRKVRRTV